MSDLVDNPEDRFSQNEAQLSKVNWLTGETRGNLIVLQIRTSLPMIVPLIVKTIVAQSSQNLSTRFLGF